MFLYLFYFFSVKVIPYPSLVSSQLQTNCSFPLLLVCVSPYLILYTHLIPVSPSTVDFLVELNTKFSSIITEKLEHRSKEAIQQQRDPETMTDSEVQKIRKSIVNHVHGNSHLEHGFSSALIYCGSGSIISIVGDPEPDTLR
jgi:hypothetical protein